MVQESLALKLRLLRARKGITLQEAARLTGLRYETISELERGLRHPQDGTIGKLAAGYGVPVEELLEAEPRPKWVAASSAEAVRESLLDAAGHDYLRLGPDGNLLDAQDMTVPEILTRLQDIGRERNALILLSLTRFREFDLPGEAKDEIKRISRHYPETVMELLELAKKKTPSEAERAKIHREGMDALAQMENVLVSEAAEGLRA